MSTAEQPPPEEQDQNALVPALLTIFSAYMVYRAARGEGESRDWKVLGIPGIIGVHLGMIAARALRRQREAAGRGGDELWEFVPEGVAAGQDAGYRTIEQALDWLDRHSEPGQAQTRDHGGQSGSTSLVPTPEAPPDVLAWSVSNAVANAAVVAVAQAAGWRYKTWQTMRDPHVRHTHRSMQGQKVGITDSFVSPSGARLAYPGDPAAPIEEVANCRCGVTTVRR